MELISQLCKAPHIVVIKARGILADQYPLDGTLFDEHFRVEGRRTWFETIEEMQAVLDKYLVAYNRNRPHQGRRMNGRTPWQAFQEGLPRHRKTNRTAKQEIQKAA